MAIYDTIVEGNRRTFISTNNLSVTGQFNLVKIDTANAGQIVLAASATDGVIGVLMNAPIAGDLADVLLLNAAGTAKAYVGSGGGITVGNLLCSDTNGCLLTTTTSTDVIVGRALWTANTGDLVEFQPCNFIHP